MADGDIQAVAPDGSTHVFPSGTSDDVINGSMRKYISGGTDPDSMMATATEQAKGAPQSVWQKMSDEPSVILGEGMKAQKDYTKSGYQQAVPMAAAAMIPGPGEGGPLLMQALKGGAYGAGVGAAGHSLERAVRGELPDIGGTLKAAATGGLTGAIAGPALNYPPVRRALESIPYLRRFLPQAEEAEPVLGSPENPAWHSKLSDRFPEAKEAPDEVAEAVKAKKANWIPTKVEAQAPAADEVAQAVKNRTASWIPTTVKPPAELPSVDPVAAAVKNRQASWIPTRVPEPEAPPVAVDPVAQAIREGRASKIPTRVPRAQPVEPPADEVAQAVKNRTASWIPTRIPKPAESAEEAESAGRSIPTLSGNPQDLISRTRRIVKPGETPTVEDLKRAGDLTQAPLPRLKQLAKFGDELAKNEINRRLKNP